MEEHNCPECGNEIYKPFSYCNACDWEKKEEEKEKPSPKSSRKKDGKMERKKEGKKGAKKAPEPPKPLKITCKCGTVIKVKSTKRPLKIKCPKCGKTGTLKTPVEPTKPTHEKKKSKTPPTDREKSDRERKSSKKDKEPKGIEKEKPKKMEKKGLEKKDKAKRKKIDKKNCPECGTRLSASGRCPDCGYRGKKTRVVPKSKPKGKPKPPKDARVVKPRKGVCSSCGSRNIRFFDDGTGRCTNCGREFHWDGGTSRMQKEEYLCKRCGEPLEYIEEYKRWYCNKCKEYL